MSRLTKTLLPLAAAVVAAGLLPGAARAQMIEPLPPEAQPHLVLSPAEIDFSTATPDKPESQQVTITNKGQADATLYEVRVAPDAQYRTRGDYDQTADLFEIKGVNADTHLAPGASAQVTVTLKPVDSHDPHYDARIHRHLIESALQVVSSDATGVADYPAGGDHTERYVTAVPVTAGGHSHLLSWMVFFPLIGIFCLFLVPKGKEKWVRWVALATCAVPVVLSGYLLAHFDRSTGLASGGFGLQMVDHAVWIRSFHIEYFMGVDGVSVLMLALTALVSLVACGASWSIPLDKSIRGYFAMFLLLEIGMMGVFASLDFFLFYVFWEVMLLPMYFLIGIWGGPRKEYAAIKFFLYTLAGSVLMLLAVIALYYNSSAGYMVDGTPVQHTFSILKMAFANDYSHVPSLLGMPFHLVVWMALFVGFAIKVPMFPFHTWLPDAHVEAPTAISVILAGVLLKMGTYGMMRICWPILPEATLWGAYAVAIFGVINIVYGALCAMAQTDLKKLVAYSSVSHMGFCLVGMAAFSDAGMSGAMMQMFNHGTITSMLFICVGILYDRAHTRDLNAFGGLATKMPKYAALFSFAFMASLGLPGLSGFVGEVLTMIGSFPLYKVLTIIAGSAVIFTAGYHLWAIQRIHLGKFNEHWGEKSEHSLVGNDATLREVLTLAPMMVIVVVLGFAPHYALDLFQQGMHDLVHVVTLGARNANAVAGTAVHAAGQLARLP